MYPQVPRIRTGVWIPCGVLLFHLVWMPPPTAAAPPRGSKDGVIAGPAAPAGAKRLLQLDLSGSKSEIEVKCPDLPDSKVEVEVKRAAEDPPDLADRLSRLPVLVLKDKKPDAEVTDALFLGTLLRQPTKAEREHIEKHLNGAANREEACRDIVWALVNSKEFLRLHHFGKDVNEAKKFTDKIGKAWEKK